MIEVEETPDFTTWLAGLADATVRYAIIARIDRVRLGNLGDWASVGDGVSELRVHYGAGWRVYFTRRRNGALVILLCGGSKRGQARDIRRAKALAGNLRESDS